MDCTTVHTYNFTNFKTKNDFISFWIRYEVPRTHKMVECKPKKYHFGSLSHECCNYFNFYGQPELGYDLWHVSLRPMFLIATLSKSLQKHWLIVLWWTQLNKLQLKSLSTPLGMFVPEKFIFLVTLSTEYSL